jgi:hypothetical protein
MKKEKEGVYFLVVWLDSDIIHKDNEYKWVRLGEVGKNYLKLWHFDPGAVIICVI